MDRIRIVGGQRLNGTIQISGAKNAALPLMIASLLTNETLTLHNMPRLADVTLLSRILNNHGADITIAGKRVGQQTNDGQTYRLRAAVWGVHPELAQVADVNYESLTQFGRERVLELGVGERGAAIVATAGYPFHLAGATNTMRIELL